MGRPDIARISATPTVAGAEAERGHGHQARRGPAARPPSPRRRPTRSGSCPRPLSQASRRRRQRDRHQEGLLPGDREEAAGRRPTRRYEIPDQRHAAAGGRRAGQDRQVQKEQQIKVQEAEIQRRERELIPPVLKQAEIERKRIETLAEAEKQRLIVEAEATRTPRVRRVRQRPRSSSRRARRGKAMNVKAEAYQEWNQGRRRRPAHWRACRTWYAPWCPARQRRQDHDRGRPGTARRAGMNKVTGDLTKMAAQIPALFERSRACRCPSCFAKIRTIGEKKTPPATPSPAAPQS